MRRRDLLGLLGGATASWPVGARGQPQERVRQVGIILPAAPNNAAFQPWVGAFRHELRNLGWMTGKNLQTDMRWATTDGAKIQKQAAELVALGPDVILAHGASTLGPLQQATRSIPIVFAVISDPVAAGYVESLSHPGGNVTGFMVSEYSLGGKWLELLKQIAPSVTRVAILRDPTNPTGVGEYGVLQGAAPAFGVEVDPLNVRDAAEIERAVATFSRSGNGGLILTPSGFAQRHRDLIISVARREKLPAVYFQRAFAAGGGLLSYGPDFIDQYRHAAGYVSRILRGEKPADLPVQAPTRYELVINMKTAKALGLDVPATLLARADEIIE